MKKAFFLIFYSPFFILFTFSCGRVAEYVTQINNLSGKEIKYYFSGSTAIIYGDSVLIPAGTLVEINSFSSTGPSKNFHCDPNIVSSETSVTIEGGSTLTINIADDDNWDCTHTSDFSLWNLRLTISDSDIN